MFELNCYETHLDKSVEINERQALKGDPHMVRCPTLEVKSPFIVELALSPRQAIRLEGPSDELTF